MHYKVVDLFLLLFFLLALFYLGKNLLWGPYNLEKISLYRENIRNLQQLLEKEKNNTERLRMEHLFLLEERNETLKAFIRDYLFMIPKDEQIFIKGNR